MLIIITGGAGFIGSAVIRQYLKTTDINIVNVDALTYAGNLESLADVAKHPNYHFEQSNIADEVAMTRIFKQYQPDAIMHLAAESHVDRSIDKPADFIKTNVVGTCVLLDVAHHYWQTLEANKKNAFRFHHISTDEVYGELGEQGSFNEDSSYQPNSPYSASKASSDHFVRAWHRTYGLPIVMTNCSNNYGPYQFPEKLMPLVILNALAAKAIPIYGNGLHVRDWLYVDDHAEALRLVLNKGVVGETYVIGGNCEKTNLELVQTICTILDKRFSKTEAESVSQLITFVADRPGHDVRYAIDSSKIKTELGWQPKESFESGIMQTIDWYLKHQTWCEHVKDGRYQGERLGVID